MFEFVLFGFIRGGILKYLEFGLEEGFGGGIALSDGLDDGFGIVRLMSEGFGMELLNELYVFMMMIFEL